jgi:hypothetical protein
MSTPTEDIILDVITSDCTGKCPYKFGDGEVRRQKLKTKILTKIKGRISDGNEVRKLTERVNELEKVLSYFDEKYGSKFLPDDLAFLRKVKKGKKTP